MRFLLDTNVISHVIRYPHEAAAAHLARSKGGDVGTSIVVSAELKFGYMRKRSSRLEEIVERLLASFEVAPWEAPADSAYARLRTHLELKGTPIGQNDMLIAAHAIALGAILVTGNHREFSRVPDLKVESWL